MSRGFVRLTSVDTDIAFSVTEYHKLDLPRNYVKSILAGW